MTDNPNIYKGDKRKKVNIALQVIIPDGLTDEEQNEFLSNLVIIIRGSKKFIGYNNKTHSKSVSIKNVVEPGWEYV